MTKMNGKIYLQKEDMPEKCVQCPFLNGSDECVVQDEDANFASDAWDDLKTGCPLEELPTVELGHWIPVTERLPESGVHVLLCCEIRSGGTAYRRYVCDGYYAAKNTEQAWNNSDDIACEYCEEDDEYYLLEGWYEVIKNWDDYNSIVVEDFVTHWMPLPEPPKEEPKS